jgi:hypothetical protein
VGDVYERSVMLDSSIAKKASEQREYVLRQYLIDEWLLPLKRLDRAATGAVVCV